jgi:histidinol dehydrogenase
MMRIITEEPPWLMERRWPNASAQSTTVEVAVKSIIEDVQRRGDAALVEYTEKFDGVKLTPALFKVPSEEISEAYQQVKPETVEALHRARDRLEANETQRLKGLSFTTCIDGVTVRHEPRPLRKVGCYVPGGKAAYPSSLVMNVTPAKVAGVDEVIVVTPPGRYGKVTPLTLLAADICGADSVYRVGGAQAMAALAFGTDTIPRVDKIVGPGNQYVTAAKSLVQRWVAIDKPAGPTEILVVADDSADPRLVALDLVSQAEHGPGGVCGVVTDSRVFADAVNRELEAVTASVPRSEYVKPVLNEGGFIYIVPSMMVAADFVDRFAPEHVEVMAREPLALIERIRGAGLILVGPYSPVSATDYALGVNHVLPTEGYGRVFGGLTVLDYIKPVSIVEASLGGLEAVRGVVKTLAEAEGLPNHARAVEERFKW